MRHPDFSRETRDYGREAQEWCHKCRDEDGVMGHGKDREDIQDAQIRDLRKAIEALLNHMACMESKFARRKREA